MINAPLLQLKFMRQWALWPMPVLTLLVLTLTACGSPTPSAEEVAVLEQGETVYMEYCAECHGAEGEGQPNWQRPGPDGRLPAPPHDNQGHTWHHADQQLLHIIAQGSILPNSDMPAYEDVLTQAEMEAVLAYIKTFWGEEEREFQQNVTDQWD